MIFPRFYNEDSMRVIGVCAPSAGVGYKLDSFDKSLNALKHKGFYIIETPSVRNDAGRSAPAEVRGAEFNALVNIPEVDIILSASGGDYNIEMLEYIDEEALRANPKWICGASDPTNILYYVTTKLDIATIYGFNAGTFDWRPLHRFQKNALSILTGKIVTQKSFKYCEGLHDFSSDKVKLNREVCWFGSEPYTHFQGRLIGGCLDVISKLVGTGFDGAADFIERYADDGIVWYFDVFDMSPQEILMTMYQFHYCGYFTACRGVIFGRTLFTNGHEEDEYVEELMPFFEGIGVPFIYNADIGHVKPAMTMINGAMADIHCADGRGIIRQALI